MSKVEFIFADISKEENNRRLRELEEVASSILKVKVKLVRKKHYNDSTKEK
jgi:hypothetical protein